MVIIMEHNNHGKTYCTKSCDNCTIRETLNCPGCMDGPGREIDGDCALARCCRDNGHRTCESCTRSGDCDLFLRRRELPEERQRLREDAAAVREQLTRRAKLMCGRLRVLFWLTIASALFRLLSGEGLLGWDALQLMVIYVIIALIAVVYGVILLGFRHESELFGRSGLYNILSGVLEIAAAVMLYCDIGLWSIICSLPAAVLMLFAAYYEYYGYQVTTYDLDFALSEKWNFIKKLSVALKLLPGASLLLMLLLPLIATLLQLAVLVGNIVISVMILVYLWRTAKYFGEYLTENTAEA